LRDTPGPADAVESLCRLDPIALLARARAGEGLLRVDGLRVRLAESFGFCQGVDRAVELALAQAAAAGEARLFVTGEIIHNPAINEQLRRAGVIFLPPPETPDRFAGIGPADRVIVPAFGIPRVEEEELARIGCAIIDTTCGWVRRVWRGARGFAGAGLTLVIHGRVQHEETRATASRIDGPWIVVRDRAEAERLAGFVRGRGEGAFAARFGPCASAGFDPARDLARLGVVNQTTMLSGETEEIAAILRAALRNRTGADPGPERFRTLDTFCPATQLRQDAVRRMIARGDLDRLIVVGGFRSSNTAHLARLGAGRVPSFHVEDAACLVDRDTIRHLPAEATEPVLARGWLPAAPATIGVTAGASTPDRETGAILRRLIALAGGALCAALLLALAAAGPALARDPLSALVPSDLSAFREERMGRLPARESERDSSGYDALHVDLTVEPDIATQSITGEARWTLRVTDPPPARIEFDLFDNLRILSATVGDVPVLFTQTDDRLRLLPPHPPAAGDRLVVTIAYAGQPRPGFLVGFEFTEHAGTPMLYTNCEPTAARSWWPCKDRPDDKFTADLRFILPDTLIAGSNGLLAGTRDLPGRRRLYHWVERYPITTYLVSLAATDYRTFTGSYTAGDGTVMPLTYYAFPEDLPRATSDWAFTPAAIGALAGLFGEYPFLHEKYGMAQFSWAGAEEHQTLTSMGTYFLRLPERSDWVVVHELAHQWWGDYVTCGTWRDIWLNEGFATYCEALWAEHLAGPDSLRAVMHSKRSDTFAGSCYDPIFLFSSTVYRKGAWVLHMLRRVVGDEVFFGALRQYAHDHAYGNAVTEDLENAFEAAWGHDLGWFFSEWVYGEGQPRYRVYWEPETQDPAGRTRVRIDLGQQTTGPSLFKMPLDVRLSLADGSTYNAVIWDSLAEQSYVVEVPAPPASLAIDPDEWVLGKTLFVAEPSGIADGSALPGGLRLALGPAAPNPSFSVARVPLRFAADARSAASRARLAVYDAAGRLVRRLQAAETAAGCLAFEWDGTDPSGRTLAPGVYFARLDAGGAGAAVRILRVR
jgi:aminopeptidase N